MARVESITRKQFCHTGQQDKAQSNGGAIARTKNFANKAKHKAIRGPTQVGEWG